MQSIHATTDSTRNAYTMSTSWRSWTKTQRLTTVTLILRCSMKVKENGQSRAHNGIPRQYTQHNGYTFHIRRAVLHLSWAALSLLTTVYSLLYTCVMRRKEMMAGGDESAYVSLFWLYLGLNSTLRTRKVKMEALNELCVTSASYPDSPWFESRPLPC